MNTFQGIEELHEFGNGNPKVKIAVLDGPVNLNHPCFNTVDGTLTPASSDFVEPSGLALSHGTAVASLIFGKKGSSVEGVASGCSHLFVPIYSDKIIKNAQGESIEKFKSASQVELARAIESALSQGAHIINISGGQLSKTGHAEFLLKKAIEKCHKAGVLIVAATGNDGCECLHVPASDHQVLAVGSMDENGEPTAETNYGTSYQVNGILAPGKNFTAATADGGTFQTGGGTSYATPIVSGVIGLLMSLQIQEGIEPNAYAIKSILETTATPCISDGKNNCRRFLRGSLNLPEAIAAIRKSPGVLASGIEYEPVNIKKTMNENTSNETTVVASSPATENILQPMGQAEQTETMAPSSPLDTKEINSSSDISLDEKESIPQSELAELIPSGDEQTTKISNLINTTTMENNTTNEATEMLPQANVHVPNDFAPSGEIDPADCACDSKTAASAGPEKTYALGNISYDFGSESHRDSFLQSMNGGNPYNPADLLEYLDANPWDASEIIWTLNIDATPIYRLIPHGANASFGYDKIRDFLAQQAGGTIERISVPGMSIGESDLMNGTQVKNLYPTLRGMSSWTTSALVGAVSGVKGATKAKSENVTNFLNQVYYKMRNLGVSAEDRALNYAATNAFQVSSVFASALKENLELDDIAAEKSPICRPGSDCYDVVLSFFNPKERLTVARKQYRFTVDVSDIVPVTVGEVRSWSVF